MSNPKISVIIPVYNAEATLRRCVDSVLSQTFTDFECLLINDGSKDRSGEISDEYAANVLKVAAKLGKAMKKGLGCEGFNLVQNNGEAAGQTVMHFHMHVIPRYAGGEDMVSWDPKPAKREELEKQGAKLREALKD